MTYNIPSYRNGKTFNGVAFQLLINNVAKDITGATINFNIVNTATNTIVKVLSTLTGEVEITDAVLGKFQIKKQKITFPVYRSSTPPYVGAITYSYEMEIRYADGDEHSYLSGTWQIIQ